MIETIRVEFGDRAYPVHVGPGAVDRLADPFAPPAAPPGGVAVIADERAASAWGERVMRALAAHGGARLFTFPPGEGSKRLARAERLLEALAGAGLDRGGVVVAVGGGIAGDLAGFVAATYMRGVRLAQVPTTLLAQVDSSVGGKVGVNLDAGKNLAGAFHQPVRVVCDVDALATLPPAEWACGFAEAVKHGAALDAAYLAALEDDADALVRARDRAATGDGRARPWPEGEAAALTRLVAGSVRLKAGVAARDEREAGERAYLNFGHSFGHAYEKLSGYRMRHGEAVAAGMVAALRLSERLTGLPPEPGARVSALLARLGVADAPPPFAPGAVVEAMRADKKNRGGEFRLVLLDALGRARIEAVAPDALLDVLG